MAPGAGQAATHSQLPAHHACCAQLQMVCTQHSSVLQQLKHWCCHSHHTTCSACDVDWWRGHVSAVVAAHRARQGYHLDTTLKLGALNSLVNCAALLNACVAPCRAVAAFPVVLGWLQQQPDSSLLLRWDTRSNSSSCSMRQRTFSWEVATVPGACPCVWSSWQLWRHAALPAAGGRLAAAKVRGETGSSAAPFICHQSRHCTCSCRGAAWRR